MHNLFNCLNYFYEELSFLSCGLGSTFKRRPLNYDSTEKQKTSGVCGNFHLSLNQDLLDLIFVNLVNLFLFSTLLDQLGGFFFYWTLSAANKPVFVLFLLL